MNLQAGRFTSELLKKGVDVATETGIGTATAGGIGAFIARFGPMAIRLSGAALALEAIYANTRRTWEPDYSSPTERTIIEPIADAILRFGKGIISTVTGGGPNTGSANPLMQHREGAGPQPYGTTINNIINVESGATLPEMTELQIRSALDWWNQQQRYGGMNE